MRSCSILMVSSISVRLPCRARRKASQRFMHRGTKIGFVTNNAARPPVAVADHLVELGIPATAADVVTSAQAAAHLLVDRFGAWRQNPRGWRRGSNCRTERGRTCSGAFRR